MAAEQPQEALFGLIFPLAHHCPVEVEDWMAQRKIRPCFVLMLGIIRARTLLLRWSWQMARFLQPMRKKLLNLIISKAMFLAHM
jgi:hypothetical protein